MLAFHLAAAIDDFGFRHHFTIARVADVFELAFPPGGDFRGPHAEFFQRLAELRGKKNGGNGGARTLAPTPAFPRTFHPALNRVVVHDLHKLSGGSTADATSEIDLNA